MCLSFSGAPDQVVCGTFVCASRAFEFWNVSAQWRGCVRRDLEAASSNWAAFMSAFLSLSFQADLQFVIEQIADAIFAAFSYPMCGSRAAHTIAAGHAGGRQKKLFLVS
jgi:hypothetical protein